jgi:hypothetical protein
MHERPNTIDRRMESFIARFGRVPHEARRLTDDESARHGAPWIQRFLGKGLAGAYVIGYALGTDWWTFAFERVAPLDPGPGRAEIWHVESYDSLGRSWRDRFNYWPDVDYWQRTFIATSS